MAAISWELHHILGMHLNGPFYGESQLNFKKYEFAYLFTTSKIQIIPVRHRCGPIKTFYHSIQPTQGNTIQWQKAKSTIWQSYPNKRGPCQNSFTKQTQYHQTKQLKKKRRILTTLHKLWGFIFQVFKLLHSFKPRPLTRGGHIRQVPLLTALLGPTGGLRGASWHVFWVCNRFQHMLPRSVSCARRHCWGGRRRFLLSPSRTSGSTWLVKRRPVLGLQCPGRSDRGSRARVRGPSLRRLSRWPDWFWVWLGGTDQRAPPNPDARHSSSFLECTGHSQCSLGTSVILFMRFLPGVVCSLLVKDIKFAANSRGTNSFKGRILAQLVWVYTAHVSAVSLRRVCKKQQSIHGQTYRSNLGPRRVPLHNTVCFPVGFQSKWLGAFTNIFCLLWRWFKSLVCKQMHFVVWKRNRFIWKSNFLAPA